MGYIDIILHKRGANGNREYDPPKQVNMKKLFKASADAITGKKRKK